MASGRNARFPVFIAATYAIWIMLAGFLLMWHSADYDYMLTVSGFLLGIMPALQQVADGDSRFPAPAIIPLLLACCALAVSVIWRAQFRDMFNMSQPVNFCAGCLLGASFNNSDRRKITITSIVMFIGSAAACLALYGLFQTATDGTTFVVIRTRMQMYALAVIALVLGFALPVKQFVTHRAPVLVLALVIIAISTLALLGYGGVIRGSLVSFSRNLLCGNAAFDISRTYGLTIGIAGLLLRQSIGKATVA